MTEQPDAPAPRLSGYAAMPDEYPPAHTNDYPVGYVPPVVVEPPTGQHSLSAFRRTEQPEQIPEQRIPEPPRAERRAVAETQERRAGGVPDRRGTAEIPASRGVTRVADEVVEKVAAIAAREVEGVHDLGGDVSRMFQSVRERIGLGAGDGAATRGVAVELTGGQAEVRLTLVVEYGHVVLTVCDAVRANVIEAVERMLGVAVSEVNILVDDIHTPESV
ncbi:Asp23/Gls24 family envelope stress response protein [Longispora sp. K20-0274]|uniref:Asp23/Gls24 family envelope stress response protein n=1 Tax=Longispora sp. K20-0274 TaxID=3088255 RepID=UPI00399AEBF1